MMSKKKARVLLCLILLGGLALNCLFIGISLAIGLVGTKDLPDAFAALIAVYSPNLALILGALQAGKSEDGRASFNSFVLACSFLVLWNLLIILRVAWFASTGFSNREDFLASVVQFWTLVGGTGSLLVVGPLGFYLTKHEL